MHPRRLVPALLATLAVLALAQLVRAQAPAPLYLPALVVLEPTPTATATPEPTPTLAPTPDPLASPWRRPGTPYRRLTVAGYDGGDLISVALRNDADVPLTGVVIVKGLYDDTGRLTAEFHEQRYSGAITLVPGEVRRFIYFWPPPRPGSRLEAFGIPVP